MTRIELRSVVCKLVYDDTPINPNQQQQQQQQQYTCSSKRMSQSHERKTYVGTTSCVRASLVSVYKRNDFNVHLMGDGR